MKIPITLFLGFLFFGSVASADPKLLHLTFKAKIIGNAELFLRQTLQEKEYALYRGTITSRRARAHPQKVTAVTFGADGKRRLIVNFLLASNHSKRSLELELSQQNKLRVRSAPQAALESKTCGQGHRLTAASTAERAIPTTYPSAPFATSAAVIKYTATVSVDCDLGCAQFLGASDARAKIAQFVNTASAFYEEDLGIALQLKNVIVRTSQSAYPASLLDSDDILNAFRLRAGDLGGATVRQLLTSFREIPDDVAGLSYVGAVCVDPSYSVGFTKHFNSLFTPFIMAHEIGHTFGAQHDPKGEGIMAAVLELPLATNFSNFSKTQIATSLNSLGSNFCFAKAATVAVATPSPIPTSIPTIFSNGGAVSGADTGSAKVALKSRITTGSISVTALLSNISDAACSVTLQSGRNRSESLKSPIISAVGALKPGGKQITFSSRSTKILKNRPAGNVVFQIKAICDRASEPLTGSTVVRLGGTSTISVKKWLQGLEKTLSSK